MEFYHLCLVLHQFLDRFNSQRDGILPGRSFGTGDPFVVSIPNGMEFYKRNEKEKIEIESFNSQRDGILLQAVRNILYGL